ncbi:MAG: peptide chain release factor N(5)-glutamine methyltransferase [Cyanosarcina radialis HA8281-LM2]|jgi:release factor glutamine methyltransferase|nr:peptide chain release factor N(5)-glutamine methyltransferase [Cyanosarcina radialis HA8281-LM2]
MNSSRPFVVSGLTLHEWYQTAKEFASQAEVSPAELEWLLQEVAGIGILDLRLGSVRDRPQIWLSVSLEDLTKLWQQRLDRRMPIQYLTGVAYWRDFSLVVSPAVLIPRPETECLIDIAVATSQDFTDDNQHWADLGTGSGAIALGLATALPTAKIHAVDRSLEALSIARRNAERLGLSDRITFDRGDWWEPLSALKGQFTGMVSNPPYIPSEMLPDLQPEVAWHEPPLALDGGSDGLDCLRHLVNTAADYLRPGGIWLVETMAGQPPAVADLLQQQGQYSHVQISPDLAGIDRFVLALRSVEC